MKHEFCVWVVTKFTKFRRDKGIFLKPGHKLSLIISDQTTSYWDIRLMLQSKELPVPHHIEAHSFFCRPNQWLCTGVLMGSLIPRISVNFQMFIFMFWVVLKFNVPSNTFSRSAFSLCVQSTLNINSNLDKYPSETQMTNKSHLCKI